MEKEDYNDIRTPLDFRRKNDFRITTLLQRSHRLAGQRRKHTVATTLVFGRSNNVGNTTFWQRYPTSRRKYNQNLMLLQRPVSAGRTNLYLQNTSGGCFWTCSEVQVRN